MRADKAMRDKEKAEARQRAQQAADSYVPVDQRKLPSPIKRCPQLERAREELLHKGGRKVRFPQQCCDGKRQTAGMYILVVWELLPAGDGGRGGAL